jgi:hypothetical protein
MRDMMSNIDVKRAISPVSVADNTAQVSQIIDMQGSDALTFVIATGSLADVDATFTVLVQHGDAANLSDAADVPDEQLIGTEALASFTFAADDVVRKIGYRGGRRYVRLTITPGANASAAVVAAVAILQPLIQPAPNPPV